MFRTMMGSASMTAGATSGDDDDCERKDGGAFRGALDPSITVNDAEYFVECSARLFASCAAVEATSLIICRISSSSSEASTTTCRTATCIKGTILETLPSFDHTINLFTTKIFEMIYELQ